MCSRDRSEWRPALLGREPAFLSHAEWRLCPRVRGHL